MVIIPQAELLMVEQKEQAKQKAYKRFCRETSKKSVWEEVEMSWHLGNTSCMDCRKITEEEFETVLNEQVEKDQWEQLIEQSRKKK